MRYHYEKPTIYLSMYGKRYICDHPVYDKGLAVTQQRYDAETKSTFWTERAGTCTNGLWPTVTIRQIMWALKMKPLQKQRWETVFDRRDI